MDYYIILNENQIYTKCEIGTNQLPFTFDEAEEKIKELGWNNAKCINISEDIINQGIHIKENPLLEERQKIVYTWNNAFGDNNINGFCMPRSVNSNEK